MKIHFDGQIWLWKGPAPWYFVTVPEEQSRQLKALSASVTYGWGMIPVTVRIGKSEWKTSLWPKDDRYIFSPNSATDAEFGGIDVPIKATIRKAEKIAQGDTVTLQLEIR